MVTIATVHAHPGAAIEVSSSWDPRIPRWRAPTPLSEREIQVLQLVADGLSNQLIARRLGLTDHTVKSHLARIGRKWEMGDRAGLVAMGMRAGVIA
jgi:DNA-binding NarL/FixJ family response regulator